MFEPVDPKQNFPKLEDDINKFWKGHNIFEKSVEQRSADNAYVFYDGPPFITGTPHYGSLLPSIAKDVIPRYQTMNGKRVERIWGWDCHGLPIETKVEKELGIKNRRDIEDYGIQKFIDQCYSYTRQTSAEWKWYIDKIGRWVDFDNSYKTMDQDYMESVMWTFKQIWEKDLIYEGIRTSLYCTRCGTPISNFEIAMDNSYEDMEDPAVTVKFEVTSEGRHKGRNVLAWTTTPWTLPANKALVIAPEETYILAKVQKLEMELERGWLINELPDDLKKQKSEQITQAYIPVTDEDNIKHARIRKTGKRFEYTKKYFAGKDSEKGQLLEKTEEISEEKYIELIKTATGKVVKTRHYYPLENGLTAEIDIYQNNLQGLQVVEVEFPSLNKAKEFSPPNWFGKEVTDSDGIYPPKIAAMSIEEVNKINEEYVQEEHDYEEAVQVELVILAKKRAEHILKDMDYEIIEEFKGEELIGLEYNPPFSYVESESNDHKIYAYPGMVHMEEGTGIVHSAPGFGDIDTEMGRDNNLSISNDLINDEGKYTDTVTDYKGVYIKEADNLIIADLTAQGIMFKVDRIIHRYPYCYRCHTPLIHKAQDSWFVNIQKIKNQLIETNEQINWVPDHLKEGRFKKGLETAPDWGVSRTRFWATPLPVWQLKKDGNVSERVVIGSRDELREKSVTPITKIVFLRHASRDKSIPDGELNDKGWKQVENLNKELAKEKFDLIISSDTNRAHQTVQELAQLNNLELIKDASLGNIPDREEFDKIEAELTSKHGVEFMSEVPEEELETALAKLIEKTKAGVDEILKKHKGKYLLVSTHSEKIALIRHIYEGRNLKESYALHVPYTGQVTMYFNNDELLDLHRPKIDSIKLKGEHGELERVPEVLDVWMDSASMPYASKHYPFENKESLEKNYPADFVVEYIAQTRAWFYVMHVVSNALFEQPPFKNVLTTGVIFGTDGRKMSKSYGNYPDPKGILEKYGAEALRLYLMGSRVMVGEDMNIDEEGLKDQIKNFILPLWNSYSFFVTYANMHNWKPADNLAANITDADSIWDRIPFKSIDNKLDQWIIARLQLAIRDIRIRMDEYNIPGAVREFPEFLNDLSKWYIRRSRDRFADGDQQALDTLYYVLVEFIKLIAPITPFISEAIYQNLVNEKVVGQPESIHLTDFPQLDLKFMEQHSKLLLQMREVREIVNLGQSLRVQQGVKIRQPLSELELVINKQQTRDYDFENWMKELVSDELNIKTVQEKHDLAERSGWITVEDDGYDAKIAIDFNLTEELKREGTLRELVRLIQNQRKKQGLELGDEIKLNIATVSEDVLIVIDLLQDELKTGVSASEIIVDKSEPSDWQEIQISGAKVYINIS